MPTTLTVSGSWAQVTGFVNGLDSFPRLFVIQKFVMAFGATGASGAPGAASGSAPALWVGGVQTAPTAGPYSVAITGSIFYTSAPNALDACAKATANSAK